MTVGIGAGAEAEILAGELLSDGEELATMVMNSFAEV
jgi:hypothetical protein